MTNEIVGMQLPISANIKNKKDKLDEIIRLNNDINEGHVLSFVTSLNEDNSNKFCELLDNSLEEAAEVIRENVVRLAIRKMVSEVVKRKPGGRLCYL